MLADYELRGLLREAVIYVDAAKLAARTIGAAGVERGTEEGVQTILGFLEKAAEELERATLDAPIVPPHRETIFPSKAMALSAIERLPIDETVGFQIRRDGEGRCSVRMWFAGRGDDQGCG